MLKKLALVLMTVCCAAFAQQGTLYSIIVNDANVFHVVGTVDDTTGGTAWRMSGGDVHVQVFPAAGYVVEKVFADYDTDKSIELTLEDASKSKYQFTMPAANVTMRAEFKKKKSAIVIDGCGEGLTCSFPDSATYGDVVEGVVVGNLSRIRVESEGVEDVNNELKDGRDTIWFTMGTMNVTLFLDYDLKSNEPEAETFNLSVKVDFSGKCSYPVASAAGEVVNLELAPNTTYEKFEFSGIDEEDVTEVEKGKLYTFIMPSHDVSLTITGVLPASSSSSVSSSSNTSSSSSWIGTLTPRYKVTIVESDNGEIMKAGTFVQNTDSTFENEVITLYVLPEAGFALDSILVKTEGGQTVKVSQDGSEYKFTMPASSVVVSAVYKTANYKITVGNCDAFACDAPSSAVFGEEVAVKVSKPSGVKKFEVEYSSNISLVHSQSGSDHVYTFTMPAGDVTINFVVTERDDSGSGSEGTTETVEVDESKTKYSVEIATSDKGEIQRFGSLIKGYPNAAYENMEIALFVKPVAGYAVDSVVVKTAGGKKVSTRKDNGYYKFTMPASDVKVTVAYKEAVYNVVVKCGDLEYDAPKTAKLGEKVVVKITLDGAKPKSMSYSESIDDLEKKQTDSELYFYFTMPGSNVEIDLDVDGASTDGKDDGKSSDSKGKDDGKSSDSKSDDGKSSGSKDDGKKDDGKDGFINVVKSLAFDVQVLNREICVSGATRGSVYMLLDMNGNVVAKGRTGISNFSVVAPNAGRFILRVANQVRALNVK